MPQAYIIPAAHTKPERTPEVREVNSIVTRVVADFAATGTIKRGLATMADVLFLGLRRTRGHYHDEIATVSTEQLADVRVAYAAYLRDRQVDLENEIARNADWLAEHERAVA